jgi:sec-independent protein translocase protein TatC
MAKPTDDDLFREEQTMPTMSFGDHIEDLRRHLILAILGLVVGVALCFIPPLSLGARVMRQLQEPAQDQLDQFYTARAAERAKQAQEQQAYTDFSEFRVDKAALVSALSEVLPETLKGQLPAPDALKGQTVKLRMAQEKAAQILQIAGGIEKPNALISLAPMESFSIFFLVCNVTGLVISSPWVFWQVWLFIAAGLYSHERAYVRKFLPFALGLFLGGVFLCFFIVLPITLKFLLEFNVWLGIEPTLRISDWVGFATILPLIFGVCFQTPLVMLIIERIGIFSAEDLRARWKHVVLIMLVLAAVITPTQDPFSLALLAGPMVALYGLGLLLIGKGSRARAAGSVA